jgi:hypothetical protein
MAEHPLYKHETLSSNPSPTKIKKEREGEGREGGRISIARVDHKIQAVSEIQISDLIPYVWNCHVTFCLWLWIANDSSLASSPWGVGNQDFLFLK